MSTHFHSLLQLARQNGGYVHFHSAPRAVLGTGIVRLKGWIAKGEHDITFKLNGKPIEVVYTNSRASLPKLFPGFEATEFEIILDARSFLEKGSRALHYSAESDHVLSEGYAVLPYQCAEEVEESYLTFFLHMAKTAGSSTRVILLNAEKKINGKNSRILATYNTYPYFPYSRLNTLTRRTLLDIDYIYGHIMFGDHELVANSLGKRPFRYITVLRNPIDFLISLYYGHYATRPSIYDWLNEVAQEPLYDNHFCRMIGNIPFNQKIGTEHLEVAKHNIDRHFAFVGLQERMAETNRMLSRITGYDLTRDTYRYNSSTPSNERDSLDRNKFAHDAMKYIEFDLQLYDYAEKRFFAAPRS